MIIRSSMLLLLGTALTVLAAWVPAVYWSRTDPARGEMAKATPEEIRWWMEMVSPRAEDEPAFVRRFDSWLGFDLTMMHGEPPPGQRWSESHAWRWRFGFPLRSMRCDVFSRLSSSGGWDRQESPQWDIIPGHNGINGFPLTPLWPGFAVDTVFFATVLWLALDGWRWMVRRRRLKRGLCPFCKYPIGSSAVCTECGEGLGE